MKKNNVLFLSVLVLLASFFLLFLVRANAQGSKFYYIKLSYVQSKIELKDVGVLPGTISEVQREGNYEFKLLSLTGNALYANRFSFPEFLGDSAEIALAVPYFPNGKEIDIYDSENKNILVIPVRQFSEITPPPISKTQEINPTLTKDNGGGNLFLYIGLGGLALGIAFAVYLFRTRSPR